MDSLHVKLLFVILAIAIFNAYLLVFMVDNLHTDYGCIVLKCTVKTQLKLTFASSLNSWKSTLLGLFGDRGAQSQLDV